MIGPRVVSIATRGTVAHPGAVNLNDPVHLKLWKQGVRWGAMREAVAAAWELADRPGGEGVSEAQAQAMAEARAHRAARPIDAHMPDSAIRALSRERADLLSDRMVARGAVTDAAGALAWLNAQIEGLGARPFKFEGDRPQGQQLAGFMARARDDHWWRRQLRRAVVRMREAQACEVGEVNAAARQVYVTHETFARRRERLAASAAMLERTQLENEDGQVFTLAELAAVSTSNKAIRRGELMTRIRGCEELADRFGHRGVFLTLTAPSRFHACLRSGGQNPRHDGSTPRDAHQWLLSTWAKARARLDRAGVRFFGFRVAEPHHDGCPHWHGLLWAAPGQLWRLVLNLKRWWLRDGGDEPGARQHRLKALLMAPGGASGYVAKYIAKGIDDAGSVGAEGHTDDDASGVPEAAQGELFGGTAARVEAWASAWGIRQFQPLGQPPVTVWRELRRVDAQAAKGATPRLQRALDAVDRKGARRADWANYVIAQGGLMRGRAYLLKLARFEAPDPGTYGDPRLIPWGVYDATGPGDVVPSSRKEWKPRGEWGARRASAVHPWTRVNNCTRTIPCRWSLDAHPEPLFPGARRSKPGEGAAKGSPCAHPPPSRPN